MSEGLVNQEWSSQKGRMKVFSKKKASQDKTPFSEGLAQLSQNQRQNMCSASALTFPDSTEPDLGSWDGKQSFRHVGSWTESPWFDKALELRKAAILLSEGVTDLSFIGIHMLGHTMGSSLQQHYQYQRQLVFFWSCLKSILISAK